METDWQRLSASRLEDSSVVAPRTRRQFSAVSAF